MHQLNGTEMKRLHRSWRRRTDQRIDVMLDGVQSPFNAGAIVRTAAAERVECLRLVNGAIHPSNRKAAKLSLGTERYLNVTEHPDTRAAVDDVEAAGLRLVCVELTDTASPAHEADLGGDVCLVVGHEDRGVSTGLLSAADEVVYLPLLGKVGSLNVATTVALAVYEARRQHWTGAGLTDGSDRPRA